MIAQTHASGRLNLGGTQTVGLKPLFNDMPKPQTSLPADAVVAPKNWFRIAGDPAQLLEVKDKLSGLDFVECAYLSPIPKLPTMTKLQPADDVALRTPDYRARQLYLAPETGGVNASYSWKLPGGAGTNIQVIDVEGAWRFGHEDLTQAAGGLAGGVPNDDDAEWRNHGTAVLGMLNADLNDYGITGICHEASVRTFSVFPSGMYGLAVVRAAHLLNPGDIILVEGQYAGPRYNFLNPDDSPDAGDIAVEWWPHDYVAIKYATDLGVIVVEAAGNGYEDLDDVLYDNGNFGEYYFPSWWENPFRRRTLDSGAIVVGAGAAPPGTHKRSENPDRSRLDYSNFGSVVDVQCWGEEVTTCGYGDLQGGPDENRWYTDSFSGTSSASAMCAGVMACVQGAMKADRKSLLTPESARQLLRQTGLAQQDAPDRPKTQRIGNRPDIHELLARAGMRV